MSRPPTRFRLPAAPAEVRRILGERDEATMREVLSLRPSAAELQQAVAWIAGAVPAAPAETVRRIVAILAGTQACDERQSGP